MNHPVPRLGRRSFVLGAAGAATLPLVTLPRFAHAAEFNYKYGRLPELMEHPSYLVGVVLMAALAFLMIQMPLKNAGDPNEPAPPTAMM